MYRFGPVQKKILLTFAGGLALGLSGSPKQYFRTLKAIKRSWKSLNQQNFQRSIKSLTDEKFLEEKKLPDGSIRLTLTREGRKQAKRLNLLGNYIKFKKPKHWDGQWRIVMFDIPEKDAIFRNILREHLKSLEFCKLQHSVFVSPYPYEKQILELIEVYSAKAYVRVITANKIDNESQIKKRFFNK